ncbi:hypothetical protein SNE40_002031 [Patella caerulea]|uniref:Calcineurin-like phosphoesterase domain-containing protein n=1 Tax=Patella caerulea TaxID=87958 RepID=A0AAN8K518_PATCE
MVSLVSVLFSALFRQKPLVRRHAFNLCVPPTSHLVLDADVIASRPVFVVGDIHGCCDELQEIVSEAQKEHGDTLFIFVGDMVNKGPKNVEVLDFISTLKSYAVRGNHDEVVLRELAELKKDPSYELREKNKWMTSLRPEHVNYLNNLPYTISLPSLNSLIVHAGLIPGIPLEQLDYNNMTNMRNIITEDYFDGRGLVASTGIKDGVPWASLWSGPEHVYFGHDARRKLQQYPHATGLDTGCLYGGCLTGIFINGCKKMIQIPAKNVYVDPNV